MPTDAPADPVVDGLRKSYEEGNLIAFVGPGVSAAAGLPTREELARSMIERLRGQGGREEVIEEVELLVSRHAYVDALWALEDALGGPEFGAAIEEALDDEGRGLPDVAVALAELKPKLRAVITTNLDRLLERAFGWPALASAPPDVATRRQILLQLHGTLLDRSTWVFSRRQFDRGIFGSPELREAFEALFQTCPVVFIGCDFADDDIEQSFRQMRALAGEAPPAHYALLPRGSLTPFRTKLLQQAGLLLIPYGGPGGPSEGPFGMREEVPALLRSVAPRSAMSTVPPDLLGPTRYVHRRSEEDEALRRIDEGLPAVIMGPDRLGKTTLLQHLVGRIRMGEKGPARVAEINLGHLGTAALEAVDAWMTSFAAYLVHELGGDLSLAKDLAASPVPWRVKLTAMVERHLFPPAPELLVLAIDDADAAWGLPFQEDVFQLLRAWCEFSARRAPWTRFRLLLSLSSSPALLKDGPAESPWNIAPSIHLTDLDEGQVRELLLLHGIACSPGEVRLLMQRVGGHPELVRLAAQRWRASGEDLGRALDAEEEGRGALGEHLFGIGERLRRDQALVDGVCAILDDRRAHVDPGVFDRLRRAGVVEQRGDGYVIRFPLYERYLRQRWRPWIQRGERAPRD